MSSSSVDKQKIVWLESLLDTTIGCYEDHRQELEKVRRELARHGANGKCVHLGPQRAGELVEEIDVVLDRSALRLQDFDPSRDYTNAKSGATRGAPRQAPAAVAAQPPAASSSQPQSIPMRQGFTNPRASAGAGAQETRQPAQQQQQQQQKWSAPAPAAAAAGPRPTAPHGVAYPSQGTPDERTPAAPYKPREVPAAPAAEAVKTSSRPPYAPAAAANTAAPPLASRGAGGVAKQPSIQAEQDDEYHDDDVDSVSDYYEEIQQRYADAEEYEPGEYNPYPSHPPVDNMESERPQEPSQAQSRAAAPAAAAAAAQPTRGRRNDPYEPLFTPPYVMPAATENDEEATGKPQQQQQQQQRRQEEEEEDAPPASRVVPAPRPSSKPPTQPQQQQQKPAAGSYAQSSNYAREGSTATSHNPPPSDSYMTTSNRPPGVAGPTGDATRDPAAARAGAAHDASRHAAPIEDGVCSSRAGMDAEDGEPEVVCVDEEQNYSNTNADGLNDDRPNDPRPEFEILADEERQRGDSEAARPSAQRRPLRTAEFRRHSPAFNNSRKVQDKVFQHRLDPAVRDVVQDSPAVAEFMTKENTELEGAKARELERLRKSFKPEQMLAAGSPMRRAIESGALVTVQDAKSGALVLAKAPPPPPDTATEDQLKREKAVLNIQMERLEREFDKAIRMHKESGSEMRYQQLHNRMNRVKRDMERVDRELSEVQRLEK